ncbi:coiled-coil domain-containing protein 162-like [Rhea pennata]|uniref:coiled-coil domain-containing protein 162-like n=1 Tax=Rhea pennata TaxID=8795 RepID=UPI002E26AC66
MMDSSSNWLQSRKKTCKVLLRHQDPITSCNLLRSFLILWKQLEILKAEWGRLKLRTEDINTVPLYKEFCEQYGTDVLYPAMKALARLKGTEEEPGGPVTSTRHTLPPRGASEIEMKGYQLRKLLESLEIHMIRDVQKKINQEMTLVTAERARPGSSLPTELWKHGVMQENFSAVRPQIVETFVQKLMENCQESEAEVTFTKSHLQQCLTALGCDIMARERSNFETCSMFYENILQQEHRLLYQKEQVFSERAGMCGENFPNKHTKPKSQKCHLVVPCDSHIAGLSHEMIMEITALRAQLTDLEEENLHLKEKIRQEVREEYESLVRSLFVTCIHLKGRLDDYRLSIDQQVFEIISEVRREGVDNIIDLKKKFGSTKNNDNLKEHLSKVRKYVSVLVSEHKADIMAYFLHSGTVVLCHKDSLQEPVCYFGKRGKIKLHHCSTYHKSTNFVLTKDIQEQLQSLRDENIRLGKLVCKLKALSCWKQAAQKAQLSAKLRDAEKEALRSGREGLQAKATAQREVALLQTQLAAAREALARSQAGNGKLKKQLEEQKQMLLEVEHRKTQEARSRQILSAVKAENMEKMLEEMEEKEQRLKHLIKETEKSSKIGQLQQKRVKKEMQQIRSQLTQERSLKLEAFQRVDELQRQVYTLEAAVSQRNMTAGRRKTVELLSRSTSSLRSPFPGLAAQVQSSRHSATTHLRDSHQHPLKPHAGNRTVTGGSTQRPKTVSNDSALLCFKWMRTVTDNYPRSAVTNTAIKCDSSTFQQPDPDLEVEEYSHYTAMTTICINAVILLYWVPNSSQVRAAKTVLQIFLELKIKGYQSHQKVPKSIYIGYDVPLLTLG